MVVALVTREPAKTNPPAPTSTAMQPMKRLEIVVDTLHLSRLLSRLREAGAPGYTVQPNASGFGGRGDQRADDPSGVSTNSIIVLAVPLELAPKVIEATRTALHKYGGVCMVSDCQWMEH